MNRVEFGYGYRRIDSGSVEPARIEVGPPQEDSIYQHSLSGRVALFKTLSKDQYERRSDFRAVASDLSLADAICRFRSAGYATALP